MTDATTWQALLRPGSADDFFARCAFTPFDTDTASYSAINARWLAELSRLVYRHDTEEESSPPLPTRSSFLTASGYRQRRFFLSSETDTQAMLIEHLDSPRHAVLVFRGTEQSIKDFVTDIEGGLSRLDSKKIDVHIGFARALDSVWDEIVVELAQLDVPIYYTGHSLGAALATLASARQAPRATYTFGSPRVGNQAFVDTLAPLAIYRIVDDQDIITTLPPEALGYRHVGKVVTLQAPSSSLGLLERLHYPPKRWADHAPINYVDRIA